MRNFGSHIFAPLPLHVLELAGASLSIHLSPCRRSTSSHEAVADWPAGVTPHWVGPANWWLSAGFAIDALIGWDGVEVPAYIRRLPLSRFFYVETQPERN